MEGQPKHRLTIMGREAAEWEQMLTHAMKNRDYHTMRSIILDLGNELMEQRDAVRKIQDHPALDHIVEWARRLVNTEPTDLESIEAELETEAYLWNTFQHRYRETFIPDELHPYIRCTPVMVSPDETGVQYQGFQKFSGVNEGACSEAVTLFHNPAGPTGNAPNFFTRYKRRGNKVVIARAYRIGLPPGSGTNCIKEHITRLCDNPRRIQQIYIDNIQNSATYNTCVERTNSQQQWKARENANPVKTPLGKLATRLAQSCGLIISSVQMSLDEYGFLDLIFKTTPADI